MTVIFPKWTNHLPILVATGVAVLGVSVVGIVYYWFSPKHLEVGYQPVQPVFYSHKLHAGLMGMDCRYCHTTVEEGPHANVPPTETCMNCHRTVLAQEPNRSLEVAKVIAASESGQPIPWEKVHLLPDYAYFPHAQHVLAGVGCKSCHGRVDQMEIVRQVEPLSMGWCLDCHRDPVEHLRPAGVPSTDMDWEPTESSVAAARERVLRGEVVPPTHCSACHR